MDMDTFERKKANAGLNFFWKGLFRCKVSRQNERHLVIKICTYIIPVFFLRYLDWIFFKITKCLSFRRVRHTTMSNRVPSTFLSASAQRK